MYDLYVSHTIGSISRPYFKAFMLGLIDVYPMILDKSGLITFWLLLYLILKDTGWKLDDVILPLRKTCQCSFLCCPTVAMFSLSIISLL